MAHVAGAQPAVVELGLRLLALALLGTVVRRGHPRPAHLELADARAVGGQHRLVVGHDARRDAAEQPALGAPVAPLLLLRAAQRRQPQRGDRRGLGHPPRLAHHDAVALLQRLLQRDRDGGAPAQHEPQRVEPGAGVRVEVLKHVVPHRRHPAREGRAALGHEAHQRLGLQPAVGHAQRGAAHHRRVGQPPGVGVEHRHDRQHPVLEGEPAGVAAAHRHRVQVRRAVAVDDSLGVAGGAGGVAHGRGVALVDLGPVEGRLGGREQLLVEVHLLAARAQRVEVGRGGLGAGDHDVLDRGHLLQPGRQQPDERVVDDHHVVLGVVGDVDQLLGEEPDVEGVQHRAHRGHREVGLEVLDVVPLEGRHPLVAVDPQPAQRRGQPRGALAEIGVGAGAAAVGGRGHDLAVGVHRDDVAADGVDGQLVVLHGAAHGGPPRGLRVAIGVLYVTILPPVWLTPPVRPAPWRPAPPRCRALPRPRRSTRRRPRGRRGTSGRRPRRAAPGPRAPRARPPRWGTPARR